MSDSITQMIPYVAVPEVTFNNMKAEIERLTEELDTWKSVFPDIAPANVQPDRALIEAENATLRAEVERLKSDRWLGPYGIIPSDYAHAMDCLRAEVERLRAALERIKKWADAYPLDVFPEPDLAKVNEVLKEAGLSLGAVSASNMRHVISGIRIFASAALTQEKQGCTCPSCKHSSDCAVHNEPALPAGTCNCGATLTTQEKQDEPAEVTIRRLRDEWI